MNKRKLAAQLIAMAALTGITFGGCGNTIDSNAAFATLDDTTITMGVANFCAKYQQAMYDSFYMPMFGEDMWNNDLYGNGNTLQEDVKTQVAENLQNMYLLKAHMADYKVEITQEEEEAIGKAADEFLGANSKKAIRQAGAENREDVMEVLRLNTIQSKMRKCIMDEADATVTDEEAAQKKFSYVDIDASGYTDEDSRHVDYTEEEKADLKKKAEDIAAAGDFDTAVTEAGCTASTETYGSPEDTDAALDTAVLEALDNLREGEITGVIEVEDHYYVARLDSEFDQEATETKKEELMTQKQEEHYDDVLSGWRDEAKWKINEEEWAKVTFEDHFKQPEEDTQTQGEEAIVEDTESISETEAE